MSPLPYFESLGYLSQPAKVDLDRLKKSAQPSRLQAKVKADKDDAKQLEQWKREVFARDGGKCRCCGVGVLRTLALHPRRAERHHVCRRDDIAVRYESRNGVLLCATCHQKVTGIVNEKVEIIGTAWFHKDGQKYINADHRLIFKKVA